MAYNFKSIADVEVIAEPAESANVLIEENGVIKKAPKTAVGGAGGVEPDMVIRTSCRPDYGSTETNLDPSNVAIIEGSHDNVLAAIREGRVPVVVIETFHHGEGYGFWESVYAAVYAYGGVYTYKYRYGNTATQMSIEMTDDGTIASVVAYN